VAQHPRAQTLDHGDQHVIVGDPQAAETRALAAETSQVMLCGNPDMVRDATEALKGLGMRKHRRRSPGQITAESFW